MFYTTIYAQATDLFNTVLNSVRSDDDIRPGKGHADITIPRMSSLPDFITAEDEPATVTVPGALLDQHFEGQFRRSH